MIVPKQIISLLVVAMLPAVVSAQTPQTGHTADTLAGHCVSYLHERSRLQQAKADALEGLLARGSMIDSALSVLSLPGARPSQARLLRQQADELTAQIEALRAVLAGEPSEQWAGQPVVALRQRLAELHRARARREVLARAHEAEGRERLALIESLRVEKQQIDEQVERTARPFENRLTSLRVQADKLGEALERAMLAFARIDEMHGRSAQAVRAHAVFAEGRLTLHWTDRRGAMLASAHLWLRIKPDDQADPPLVLERYPVLLQNQQEVQISAGHFLIEFRVSVDELSGESRVLKTATRLLDIDALGRLVPRLGDHGLD